MAGKNEVINRWLGGVAVGLMVVIAAACIQSNAALNESLNNHKDDDTPHAGIAVNDARFMMVEGQLEAILKLLRESP